MSRGSSVSPTREQLLATRRRISAVQYGRKLLERKRDALIRSVEEQRRLFRRIRAEFEEWNGRITFVYSMVRMYEGSGGFRALSAGVSPVMVQVERHAVMGCRYAQFFPKNDEWGASSPMSPFDLALTPLSMDDLLTTLSGGTPLMWQYINLRTKIVALERELSRTNLKINTLKHVVFPSLVEEEKRIEEALSERERQEKFVAKRVGQRKRKTASSNREFTLDRSHENQYS